MLTPGFTSYILLSGMNLKLDIGNAFTRKAICVGLILFMSIGFSFGGAQANSCDGGADCLICARQPHRHLAGAQASMEKPGCPSGEQNSACGFEAGQGADKFYGIASAVSSLDPARSGFTAGAFDDDGQFPFSRGLISSFSFSDPGGKAPIYLLKHSLLR